MENILNSPKSGKLARAKRQLQEGCKTKPEEQAARLGRVVLRLMDPAINEPAEFKLAKMFVAMFS